MKTLKLFNGRGHRPYERRHFYIAAYSRADACRVLSEHIGGEPDSWNQEVKVYYSHGAWGNAMEGIEPERGLWVSNDDGAPTKLVQNVEGSTN